MGKQFDEYEREFKLNIGPDETEEAWNVAEHAWRTAVETRQFEITLYWQRTAYFWAFIAVSFGGFFAILTSNLEPNKDFYAFAVACVGFLFSLAWFLVNKGSKFWQENWENHVDMLEDKFTGPLFKTILRRDKWSVRAMFDGPAPYSVSKINQWMSLFVMFIWLSLGASLQLPWTIPVDARYPLGIVTALFAILLLVFGRTSFANTELTAHKHLRIRKLSIIVDE